MYARTVTVACAALLLTASGLSAQTSPSPSAQPGTPGASQPGSPGASGSPSASPGSAGQNRSPAMSQDRLRQVLGQAGFQNVRILDAAYLVQAQTREGDTVMMVINPPSGAPATTGSTQGMQQPGMSGSSGQGSGGSGQNPAQRQ